MKIMLDTNQNEPHFHNHFATHKLTFFFFLFFFFFLSFIYTGGALVHSIFHGLSSAMYIMESIR